MKIEQKDINFIKTEFEKMETRQEFVSLLNFANSLLYGADYIPIQLKHITYYSFPNHSKKVYKKFTIKKKSGAERTIYAPQKILKAIQKALALILQCVYEPHSAATGFIMGKSIVDNAKEHIGQNYVYNMDLKDFFPSIDQARVWACLKLYPFNLNDNSSNPNIKNIYTGSRMFKTDIKESVFYIIKDNKVKLLNNLGDTKKFKKRLISENKGLETEVKKYILTEKNIKELNQLRNSRLKLANIIANLVCTEIQVERKDEIGNWVKVNKNVLPQGAPTSPVLSNIVSQKLDHRLTGLSKRFNLNYTRYADDITFSSMHNVYQGNGEFLKELTRIIKDQNFNIKESKTRLQKTGYRQEVTGLVVNDDVNVRKRYVKQIRMWLYYWEKYGYAKAEGIFHRDYAIDKGHVKKAKPNFQNVLSGKLEYLKMVKGVENTTYLSLNKRFEKLLGVIDPIDRILNEWENNGIESAMNIYKTDAHE